MGFIIKVLVGAAALWVADRLISGIELTGDIWQKYGTELRVQMVADNSFVTLIC